MDDEVALGPQGIAVTLLASAVTVMSATRATTAEVPACYTVQQGDTAALISVYLTGSVEHTYAPWFQIVDASGSRVVPKSHYSRIQPGWRACIPSSRLRVEFSHSTTTPRAAAPGRQSKTLAENIPAIAWWGVAVMAVLLIADAALRYATRRRAVVSMMQQFGERFVCEFERPLMEPGCLERPVESRLHVIPGRKRLEILLAPTGRRRYPNLSDHRRNVTYDANRVVRLLKDERFVGGQLGANGRWVVITCHFRMQAQQKGTQ
jgi:hypothetical protein